MKYSLPLKNALQRTGVMSIARHFFKGKLVAILRYHSIVDPQQNYYAHPSICVSPSDFEKHLNYFKKHYNIISLDTLADCIHNQAPFPPKALILTFDDGYKDNYHAYQLMKASGVTGTFYVSAGCLHPGQPLWLFEVIYLINNTSQRNLNIIIKGEEINFSLSSPQTRDFAIRKITQIVKSHNMPVREEIRQYLRNHCADVSDFHEKAETVMLTWDQVKEMSDNGMTIGGHTLTHLNLPNAHYDDALSEITNCKTLIEANIEKPVRHFSYPNGGNYLYYNDLITQLVKQSGYATATTSNNGLVTSSSNLFELNRIRITNDIAPILYQIHCEPIVNNLLNNQTFRLNYAKTSHS